LNFIRHTDWLGSSRLATTWAHGVYSKEAYAPFGETYNEAGTPDRSFTGQDQDTVTGTPATGTYDFLFRKYDPAAGRWLSPDPAGWGAVDMTNPQTFNRDAYVLNLPTVATDPTGLILNCFAVETEGGYEMQCVDVSETIQVNAADPNSCTQSNPNSMACLTTYQQTPLLNVNVPGYAPNNGPSYSHADVCAASTLLNKGAGTFLDALGIIPGEGNLLAGIQAGAGLISAGMAVSGGSATDLAFSGGGLGLTAASLTYSKTAVQTLRTTAISGSKMIPILGNILSIGATANDIWGKEGMVNYYNDCMAGKN
jgi:RHS repeat-associated protein